MLGAALPHSASGQSLTHTLTIRVISLPSDGVEGKKERRGPPPHSRQEVGPALSCSHSQGQLIWNTHIQRQHYCVTQVRFRACFSALITLGPILLTSLGGKGSGGISTLPISPNSIQVAGLALLYSHPRAGLLDH